MTGLLFGIALVVTGLAFSLELRGTDACCNAACAARYVRLEEYTWSLTW